MNEIKEIKAACYRRMQDLKIVIICNNGLDIVLNELREIHELNGGAFPAKMKRWDVLLRRAAYYHELSKRNGVNYD